MRRFRPYSRAAWLRLVLVLALPMLPLVATASAAGAAGASCQTDTATVTFSPPLPMSGDASTVVPTVSGTETFSGCSGFGVTQGTATFTGTANIPYNCDRMADTWSVSVKLSVHWDNGQDSTMSGLSLTEYSVTSGFDAGARFTTTATSIDNGGL